MEGRMAGFVVWAVVGITFSAYGVFMYCSKKEKPFGFWANAEQFPVNDVTGYNHALGKLFLAFGIVFALLGLPLLQGQNSSWIIISIFGCMAEVIVTMSIYVTVIEKKYRKKL